MAQWNRQHFVTFLSNLKRNLSSPALQTRAQSLPQAGASVAVVFRWKERSKETLELLFIRRSINEWDTWSGQVAFPGGKRQIVSSTNSWESDLETAQRETMEEIGLDLSLPHVHFLGSLPAIQTHLRTFWVSTQVFFIDACAQDHEYEPKLQDEEIADVFWINVHDLFDKKRHKTLAWPIEDLMPFVRQRPLMKTCIQTLLGDLQFGCIYLPRPNHEKEEIEELAPRHRHDFILWGLTMRMVYDLMELGELPLPMANVPPHFESKLFGRLALFLYRHPDQALIRTLAATAMVGSAVGLYAKL